MTLYSDILNQAKRLPLDEKLRLIAYLSEQTRLARKKKSAAPKSWYDLRGAAPYPLMSEDAQKWISASRQEDEDHRNKQLHNKP
jgi:hypothetical protein